LTRDGGKIAHQRTADSLPPVLVNYSECDFRPPRLNDNVAPTPDDRLSAILIGDRHQGDLVDKIDVQEVLDFLFQELVLHNKKATIEGFVAHACDRRPEAVTILRPLGPDLDPSPVSQRFNRRKVAGLEHDRRSSAFEVD
jgi:hypothetical protein